MHREDNTLAFSALQGAHTWGQATIPHHYGATVDKPPRATEARGKATEARGKATEASLTDLNP